MHAWREEVILNQQSSSLFQANIIFWALTKHFLSVTNCKLYYLLISTYLVVQLEKLYFSLEYIVLGPALFEYELACRYISKCREERGRVVIMASISPDRYLMKWVCSTGCSSSVKVSLKVERRSIRSRTTKGKMTERVEQMCWRQSDSHSLSWIGLWWWAA